MMVTMQTLRNPRNHSITYRFASLFPFLCVAICTVPFAQCMLYAAQLKPQTNQPEQRFTGTTAATQAMALPTTTGTLYGTLEIPASSTPVPVVLMMAGHIPIDRNGNSHLYADSTNTMKYLAEALLRQGIATLRYDKRGVAQSSRVSEEEEHLTVDMYVSDAVLWGKKLQEDKRFSTVTVLGYDESSLIAMIAAKKLSADGYVSVAGFGRPMQEIMLENCKPRFPAYLFKQTQAIISSLEQGRMADSVPTILYMILRPTIQPYMMSLFRYNPAKEIGKLSMPCLVVHGTKDYQMLPQEATILAQGNPNVRLAFVEGMTHNLRDMNQEPAKAAKSRFASFQNPIMPKLISDVSEFVKTVRKKKP